jgi:lysophospholipase L1-like esterase
VQTYNAAIPALVAQRTSAGRHLVLVDMYEAFTRDASYKTTLLGDNLHPNEAGYIRLATTWYAALAPYLR